jgi:hypothetical protein
LKRIESMERRQLPARRLAFCWRLPGENFDKVRERHLAAHPADASAKLVTSAKIWIMIDARRRSVALTSNWDVRDGSSYLIEAKRNGVVTPLSRPSRKFCAGPVRPILMTVSSAYVPGSC